MKRSFKRNLGLAAIFTFLLNMSMSENGGLSFFSSAKAEMLQQRLVEDAGWTSTTVSCYDSKGTYTGSVKGCAKGTDATCTPDAPCGETKKPDIED